jgi:hypothetical protein
MVAMTSSRATAQVPKLPAGSKVFIASMDGFDKYFRAATKRYATPLTRNLQTDTWQDVVSGTVSWRASVLRTGVLRCSLMSAACERSSGC